MVKREQIGRALQQHQDDLLDFVGDLGAMVVELPLEPHHINIDLGVNENERANGSQLRTVPLRLGASAVGIGRVVSAGDDRQANTINVTFMGDRASEIELTVKTSRIYASLRQHLRGDGIWKHLDLWEKALLEELQARATLNRAVAEKAADIFNAPLKSTSKVNEPSLTNVLPLFVSHHLIRRKGGDEQKLGDRVKLENGGLHDLRSSSILGTCLGDNALKCLGRLLDDVERSSSFKEMVEAHEHSMRCVKRFHLAIEEYQLLHYIRGTCRICKRLGVR